MAKILSARQTHAVDLDGVSYTLRTPTVYDKVDLNYGLRRAGCRLVSQAELSAVLREGIEKVYEAAGAPEESERILGLLEDFEQLSLEIGGLDPADAGEDLRPKLDRLKALGRDLEDVERVIEDYYEPYRHLLADRERWLEMAPVEAARLCLVEVQGGAEIGPIAKSGATREQIGALPIRHVSQIGFKALSLFGPSEAQAKNSESPPDGA